MNISSSLLLSFLDSLSNLVSDLTRICSVGGLKEKTTCGTCVQYRVVLFIVRNYRYLYFVVVLFHKGDGVRRTFPKFFLAFCYLLFSNLKSRQEM